MFMETNLDDLKHIRSMMELSSKFLSLSGISGIMAGCCALLGSVVAYELLKGKLQFTGILLYDLIIVALLILLLAGISGLYFSMRKAKKMGSKFWLPATRQIIVDFTIPMLAGGAFCIIAICQHSGQLVAPAMLIFYGLALIFASSRTYSDIKYLGACEIILGLLAGIFTANGLLFWAFGFGVLHVVYGIVMYYKYDIKTVKND